MSGFLNCNIIRKAVSGFLCLVMLTSAFAGASVNVFADEVDIAAQQALSTVPTITVTTAEGNGCELQKADGYVTAEISVKDVDGSVLADSVEFKVRGNTTALKWVEKKAFTFKFSKKKNVLGMGKGKKWALIANAFDPTLLRNYLAFETARELGLDYTSEKKFVELWLDGSFRGSYLLCEPVQAGSDRVDIDVDSNGGLNDFLVEYESTVATPNPDDTYFTVSGARFIAKEPEEPTDGQLEYLKTTLGDIITTLKAGTRADIEEKVDMTSFVRYYLLNEYYKTYDFSVTSVYFYYKDGRLYAGPAWDYDLSMGNENPETSQRCKNANSPQGIFANTNLYAYLAKKDWFKELVKREYEENYDFFSNLHTDGGILDTIRAAYSDTIERNFSPDGAGWKKRRLWITLQRKPENTNEGNYAFLKNWLAERNQWFEEYFEPFKREFILGDTDGNGKVTIRDATYIQLMLLGLIDSPEYELRGKVTGDVLNINDVTEIQKHIVGLGESNVGQPATGIIRH